MSNEIILNESKKYIISNIQLQIKNNIQNKSTSILYLSGPPGIGKSDLMNQIAIEIDASIDVKYLSTMMIEQISGLPVPTNSDTYKWSKPEVLSISNNPKDIHILFLDDLHLCTKTIQNYLFQLLTYKSIHSHKLPSNVAIVVAGNRSSDKAGAQSIMAPIVNRFYFLDVRAEAKDWINSYAIKNDIRQDIISFIGMYPELLQSPPMESSPWASPRSWSLLSDNINEMERDKKLSTSDLFQLSKGHLGLEYANKYVEYIKLYSKWNSIEMLLGHEPMPDFSNITPIDSYTCMSAMIAEFMKEFRSVDYDLTLANRDGQFNVIKKMFVDLQKTQKAIIPLGMRTLILDESAKKQSAKIYTELIKGNPELLEAIKSTIGWIK